jgi:hypothetical protein
VQPKSKVELYAAMSTTREYVRKRRPEIRLEAGRAPPLVFIEQSHRPGAEAEVDFGDVWIRLAGELTRCYLFSFRLSWSGKAIHRPIDRTNSGFWLDYRS